MDNLYNKLNKYCINDAIKFEETDRQFLALKNLFKNKKIDNENYLFLIIINSLVCYQLSWKWEDYWEEFSESIKKEKLNNFIDIYIFFENFLPKSKNNKRFIETKLKRLKKLENFYLKFLWKIDFFYKNMDKLVLNLSKIMNQKQDAKTIVFAVKMFSYWSRNVFEYLEYFPKNIMIPIDSRLENLYKKYENIENINTKKIKDFYIKLSKQLKIPLLHLDAILWLNYDELMK